MILDSPRFVCRLPQPASGQTLYRGSRKGLAPTRPIDRGQQNIRDSSVLMRAARCLSLEALSMHHRGAKWLLYVGIMRVNHKRERCDIPQHTRDAISIVGGQKQQAMKSRSRSSDDPPWEPPFSHPPRKKNEGLWRPADNDRHQILHDVKRGSTEPEPAEVTPIWSTAMESDREAKKMVSAPPCAKAHVTRLAPNLFKHQIQASRMLRNVPGA
ncbi:hypothetical protein HDV57DRAFT_144930 [Trichoderma longibrachiatum]|uniref:Uncharacterized protein n=1 Tax=Trichoderma longibrachiatum ATCC 18648 TaxID=983965 RepID=A0A2T4C6X6_TRILO|nr:hypothetical protein M440DRAFT_276526 [Trichoderma longibrachiatum ATCC 18648]